MVCTNLNTFPSQPPTPSNHHHSTSNRELYILATANQTAIFVAMSSILGNPQAPPSTGVTVQAFHELHWDTLITAIAKDLSMQADRFFASATFASADGAWRQCASGLKSFMHCAARVFRIWNDTQEPEWWRSALAHDLIEKYVQGQLEGLSAVDAKDCAFLSCKCMYLLPTQLKEAIVDGAGMTAWEKDVVIRVVSCGWWRGVWARVR